MMAAISSLLSKYKFNGGSEYELQDAIAKLLVQSGFAFQREVKLSDQDRIDFMVGRCGMEVKIGHPWSTVVRQLQRYALSPDVDELVLVTNKIRLTDMPISIGGKPVTVAFMGGGLL